MKTGGSTKHLVRMHEVLQSGTFPEGTYVIPSVWMDAGARRHPPGTTRIDPQSYYSLLLKKLIGSDPLPFPGGAGGSWSDYAVVYSMIIRTTCAFDHDRNGTIDPVGTASGWRETGTFLKSIAILPYLRTLGVNTIHLLPVFLIGECGRRGSFGSPYAVKDFSVIDPNLAESCIDMTAEEQFLAFIEGAHRYGFRVILEIPLRTVSRDSSWIPSHPEWFYWIRDEMTFRPPVFGRESMDQMEDKVSRGDLSSLPAPPRAYTEMFTNPPVPDSVVLRGKCYHGKTTDGTSVTIPGAFADWPPDDHQPVWDDITYLKYYQDPEFNYMAYNTLRMYDSRITKGHTETNTLWEALVDLVREFAGAYGIDGLMIDMAHALPPELERRMIRKGREVNEEFVFWAEDFSRQRRQRESGYNAVLGAQWACQHRPEDFKRMLGWISETPELPLHLATPETHNTPRSASREGGKIFSRYAWAVGNFIPAIPFIHSGFELGETRPVNTGLGFTRDELRSFRRDDLPLFSCNALNWEGERALIDFIRNVSSVRSKITRVVVTSLRNPSFSLIDGGSGRIIAFSRSDAGGAALLVAANPDMKNSCPFRVSTNKNSFDEMDLLTGDRYELSGDILHGTLEAGRVVVFQRKG